MKIPSIIQLNKILKKTKDFNRREPFFCLIRTNKTQLPLAFYILFRIYATNKCKITFQTIITSLDHLKYFFKQQTKLENLFFFIFNKHPTVRVDPNLIFFFSDRAGSFLYSLLLGWWIHLISLTIKYIRGEDKFYMDFEFKRFFFCEREHMSGWYRGS